jgi:uncharacterized protein (DUF1800 family)
MFQQNETMRQFAGGRFGELLRRMAKDPALLIWLDADANRKEHPNENLAREMMELFSLGVGNYSDNDVKEAARAITGWSVTRGKFRHFDEYHDDGEKTIFGRKGQWTGDDFLNMLLDQPAIAKRVAFRIGELFLGENLVAPNDPFLRELAEGLRERMLDVAWAIETVLRSEAFFADKNIGNRILGPAEFVIGTLRSLEILAPPPSTLLLAETVAQLGQDLLAPPNVFGWPGGRSWLTSRTVIGRANFASALVSGQLHSPSKPFDAAQLARSYGFTSPDEVAAFFAQLLLGRTHLPAELKPYIEQMMNMETVEKANELVAAILSSPEAQLA